MPFFCEDIVGNAISQHTPLALKSEQVGGEGGAKFGVSREIGRMPVQDRVEEMHHFMGDAFLVERVNKVVEDGPAKRAGDEVQSFLKQSSGGEVRLVAGVGQAAEIPREELACRKGSKMAPQLVGERKADGGAKDGIVGAE